MDEFCYRTIIPCHTAARLSLADIPHKDGSLKASKQGSLQSAPQSTPETDYKSSTKFGGFRFPAIQLLCGYSLEMCVLKILLYKYSSFE